MRGMKRILAMLLAVVMVVGLIPATVFAAETVLDAAIFCSDLHGSTSNLESILGQLSGNGVDYSSIGFVGDTCLNEADLESLVKEKLGDSAITDMYSYAESHDGKDGGDIYKNWDYSGEVEGVSSYYLVYTIRETDMQNSSGASTAAPAFTSWYNSLTTAEKALPIFIMSHRPLHDRRDDNAGAATWYSAISAAAETSDIVFFWAHNHTGEDDVDRAAYYVASSRNGGTETISVYNGSTVVPNFTYMNAGYIDANGQNPKRKPVATTVQITADSLIFQDYTTSGTYTNSSYSHNVTVERVSAVSEPAVTLSSIAISGTTSYYVGDELALTVTATYSDTTTKDVTAEATLTGYNMSAAGTYTVTAAYEGKEATCEITVAEPYVTRIEITADPTKTVYDQGDELDTNGMVVTAIYNNGATAVVTPTSITGYDMSVVGQQTVNVNYYVDGYTYSDTFTITVNQAIADDATLTKIEITTDLARKEYQVNDALDISGMVVKATFSDGTVKVLEYDALNSEDVDGYILDDFSMYVEKAHEVKVSYTYKDVTCSDTTTINVWNYKLSDETTGVTVEVADEDYGVTAVNVAESTNENVAEAIQYVITGDNYVAYDITLTYDEGYSATEDAKTVTLPIPEGVTNPVVYYVSDSGTAVDMKAVNNGDGTVSFTTTHFSTYVLGDGTTIETESGNATTEGSSTTTTKTVYVLVSTPTAGNQYIIVSSGSVGTGYALKENTTTGASVTINAATSEITNPYIETSDETIMWNTSTGMYFQSESGGYYLRYRSNNNGLRFSTTDTSNATWTVSANSARGNNRYLKCNNGTWTASSGSASVYFYEKQTINVTTGTPGHTYSVEGTDMEVAAVKDATVDLSSILYDTPTDTNVKTDITVSSGLTPTYEVVTTKGNPNVITSISGNTATLSGVVGTAVVKVTYTSGDLVAWDEFIVTAAAPDHYGIQLHKAAMTEATGVTADNVTNYYVFNTTTGVYEKATSYVEGTTYYTTPVIQGDVITAPVALKGIEAGDTYAVWAVVKAYATADATEGVDLGTLGDALHWTVSDESIAKIDEDTGVITFTGNNYGTFTVTVSYEGADGQVITDTITISVTESLYVVPGDGTNDFPEYPNEGAVRFDKTATAVGNYSETGIAMVELSMTGVPYTTGSELDVVVMLDMSTSMDDDRIAATVAATKVFIESIVKNEDGSYNSNRVYVGYFNGDTVYTITGTDNIGGELASVDNDTEYNALIAAIEDEYDGALTASGTNYDVSLEECYNVLTEAKSTNLPPEAETAADYSRQQFVVFMSDGGPTDYATSASNVVTESTIVDWFNVSDSDSANWTNSMTEEYWSGLMKDNGVTIYSVGLILQEAPTSGPQDYRDYSADQNYYVTSTLLTSIASGADYFFNCESSDDTTEMESIFSNIATEIHEAATNVVVEDKIGSSYTMNFSLPGYNTDNQLDSTALDGLSNFYIQVVDYVLDSTTHERTDTYTVLENFTFNLDGSLKSHTVDGAACGDTCSHVTTTTDGVITAIDGTYFDYKSDSTGEYLTWTAEKLNENELALQYFAYLDNSSGVAEADQIPAGTYYTNEYATLTYTNVNGNQVQQEFPVPQMTWYGAQVSYVFYLVNEAGQPVNRAGRVVPFAEAVYVTDVYTEAVVWNDLEQSAGLEAERLAEELVPDVYALYDNDASYNIHVYADEDGVNLNNHFVIGGDVTDDYNTATNSWTNAKTTYVFNNKSDGTKYNIVGAYIANDGSDTTTTTTYLCKGEGTISDVTWGEVTLTSDSDLVNGAYYYDVNGVKTRALTYVEGTTYYELTGASYTAASGETHWTPGTGDSTTGGTVINNHVYYVDEYGNVYTIVQKSDGTEVREGFDFANTTVAFAVVWKPQLEPDTVVVDFGLDVVIDVIANDAMAAGVTGVMLTAPNAETDGTYETEVGLASVTSTDGLWTASTIDGNLTSVRFHMNEMGINAPVTFYYEAGVNYYKTGETTVTTTNMYSSVTVIPATTVYYEDSFVTLDSYTKGTDATWTKDETSQWTASAASTKTQDVDRPGASKISEIYDADNVYGYDSAYDEMSTYSLGSAAVMEIKDGVYGTATFTFYGTGFDIIGVTSSNTSLITLKIYSGTDTTAKSVKNLAVDTYYGYTKDSEGNWIVDSSASNTLYQVPVISYEGLTYGQYTVVMKCAYNSAVDHQDDGSYNVYLDAIRVYDPTGVVSGSTANDTDSVVSNAYNKDGEAYPAYQELRANIIAASGVTVTKNADGSLSAALTNGSDTIESLDGMVFIDGSAEEASVSDYVSYGPNNELYLAKDQAIAFKVNLNSKSGYDIADVQIGLKSADGSTVTYTINGTTKTLKTTTDMYYSILDAAMADDGKATVVTITNTSNSILSLTNIKVTYKESETTTASEESGISAASLLYTDEEVVTYSLMRMSRPAVEDTEEETETTEPETEATEPEVEETVPEETVPEETVPEETVPEETVPEETVPEETVPEETVPEETVPEETEPEVEEDTTESITDTIKNFFNKISNAISNLLSRWFR